MPVIRARAAFSLVLLVGSEASAPAKLVTVAESALPDVEVVRAGPYHGMGSDAFARQHYTDVSAIISGNFTRPWDGSTGSYKLPLRLIYPDFCADAAVVESLHPNLMGEPVDKWAGFHIPGQSDPVFDPLFDLAFNEAFSNIGARGLFGAGPDRGHVYAGLITDNISGAVDYVAAQPANQALGLHLDRPGDEGLVFAGVSRWLREHGGNLGALRGPCVVDQVVLFGYSWTATQARSFLFSGLNTELADGGGRVFDGTLLGGDAGPWCADLRSQALDWVSCEGATPRAQGPVISVRSDTDFEWFAAELLRPGPADDHYVVHHIAGAAHVDENELDFAYYAEYFGLDSPVRQNTLDKRPVFRADLQNLLRWAARGVPPPPTTLSSGTFLPDVYGFGVLALDLATGNTAGGVQLPMIAAPLGLYRGVECHGARDLDGENPYLWASGDLQTGVGNYVLEPSTGVYGLYCLDAGTDHFVAGPLGWEIISGVFLPYTAIPGDTHCAQLYPTRRAYDERVTRAARELASAGFLLEDEVHDVIAAAETAADEHPDCVPAR